MRLLGVGCSRYGLCWWLGVATDDPIFGVLRFSERFRVWGLKLHMRIGDEYGPHTSTRQDLFSRGYIF